MLLLVLTTDKLQLVTNPAADVDVHASWVDQSSTTFTPGKTNTAITTATTTDIVAAPAASTVRNIKTLHIRNKDSVDSTTVTVVYDQNGTDFELHKVTLAPGEALEYVEGIGFFTLANVAKLSQLLYVTSNVVNATTSFADITGLTTAVLNGKKYAFEAHLSFETNATTTGARFGANGPASPTLFWIGQIAAGTPGIAASNIAIGVATAYDTAIAASTTGPGSTRSVAHIGGFLIPSADGTFALRLASEVAVASGLTLHAGSWLDIREVDN